MRVMERKIEAKHYGIMRKVGLYDVSFENLEELVGGASMCDAARHYAGYAMRDWIGTESIVEFLHKMRDGWPELIADMRRKLSELPAVDVGQTQEIRYRRKRTRGDHGNEIDIHAVYQGHIDRAWDRTEREPKLVHNKLVHMVLNVAAMSEVTAKQMIWRAAACYRLCEALEASGYSVAITIARISTSVWPSPNRDDINCFSVPVKAYHERADEERLAVMMNGGFYRYYLLAKAMGMTPRSTPHTGPGGSPYGGTDVLPFDIQREKDSGALVAFMRGGTSLSSAQDEIRQVIAALVEHQRAGTKEVA